MTAAALEPNYDLVGIGLYTPAEAARLIRVRAGRLVRWLRGHEVSGRAYEPLWKSQIDLGDGKTYLGFRDLMEARVTEALIGAGLSAQKVRKAILIAREIVGDARPLSTARLRTDGSSVFLERIRETGDTELIDVLRNQHVFKAVFEPSLRDVEYDGGAPSRWWPQGRKAGIVVDPGRQFGAPIDFGTGVPTSILASAAVAQGSIEAAARAYYVPPAAIRQAVAFEQRLAA